MARRSIALTLTFLATAGAGALAVPAAAQTLSSQTVKVPAGPRDRPVVAFGTHDVAAAPVVQPIVLLNSSVETITLAPPVVQNPMTTFQKRTDPFALDGETCSAVPLAPGQWCTVYVRLTPALSRGASRSPRRAGDYSYLIVTPAGKPATRVTLEAHVRHPSLLVPIGSTPLRFGRARVGSVSMTRRVRLEVQGSYDLVAGRVTLEGEDASQFRISADQCSGLSLKPFALCSYEVAFAPTSAGLKSAAVEVVGAGGSPPRTTQTVFGTGLPTGAQTLRLLARRAGYLIAGGRLVRLLTRPRFSLGSHAWPAAGSVRAWVEVATPSGRRSLAESRSMPVLGTGRDPVMVKVRKGALRALTARGKRRWAIVRFQLTGADGVAAVGERRLRVSGRLPKRR
jgi:hypothetical protein